MAQNIMGAAYKVVGGWSMSKVEGVNGGWSMGKVERVNDGLRLPFRHTVTTVATKEPSVVSKPCYKVKQAFQ